MSNKKTAKASIVAENNGPLEAEMDELRREMRSAKWVAWAQDNQQSLLAGVVALVLALVASGLWVEQNRSRNESAATLYQQAQSTQDADKKLTLLENITSDFSGSSYAVLALMQLAAVDKEHAEKHLNAIIEHPEAMTAWVWQARLDLAELKIEQGDQAAAKTLLDEPVGEAYKQLKYYLLAGIATDEKEKQDYLHKAQDAASYDEDLKRRIEALLSTKK
jgi:predicted negative regulator of RcsB-dependent stress response